MGSSYRLFFAIAIAMGLTRSSFAQCWANPQYYNSGGGTYSLAKADVTGDGIEDIVSVNGTGNTITVLPGNPSGTFPTSASYSTSAGPTAVTLSDFDGDTDIDAVVASYSASNIMVHLNNGSGVFIPDASYPVSTAQGITSGDFDGDTDMDVAVVSYGTHTIHIFPNNGNATFAAATIIASGGANPGDIISGNFDNGTSLDLAVVNINSSNLVLFMGNGAGAFTMGSTGTTGTYPRQIAAQDINGDTYPDFAVANNYIGAGATVFTNNNGTLSVSATIASPVSTPLSVEFLKLAGDGQWDLAIGNSGSIINIAKGNGNGTFQPRESFHIILSGLSYPSNYYTQLYRLIRKDLNGDGTDDLVGANYQGNSIETIFGNSWGWINAQWHNYYNPANVSSWEYILSEDLNSDSKWDLVTISSVKDSMAYLTGNGDGTFVYNTIFYTGDNPTDMIIADFNGDTKKDIAVLNYLSKDVKLFLNSGTGVFTTSSFTISTTYPDHFSQGDLDNDSDLDLLVVDNSSGNILTYLNDGAGNFSQNSTIMNTNGYYYASDITAGYFNSDNIIDFAVSYTNQQKVTIWLASAILTYPSSYDATGFNASRRLENTDINNDNMTDLLLGYSNSGSGGTFTYLNGGTGNYSYTSSAAASPYNYVVEVADFNMDGKKDIVSTSAFTNGPGINSGNGDGTFAPATFEYTILADPGGATARDFNGDGSPDLAVTDISYRSITVLLNASPMINLGADRTVCNGTTLSAGSYQGNYTWSTGSTSSTINVTSSGTYWVSLTNACATKADTVTITVAAPIIPTITASGPTIICAGDSVTLSSSPASSYLWSTSSVSQSVTTAVTGTYSVTTSDGNGCTASASQTVTVNTIPVVTISINPDTVCTSMPSFALTGESPPGGIYSGSGVSGGNFNPSSGMGTHIIYYTYTDGAGCADSDSAMIFVDLCTDITETGSAIVLVYPNPFNDHAMVSITGNLKDVVFIIHDMLGKEVKRVYPSSDNFRIDREEMSDGLYFFTLMDEHKIISKGKLIITK